jgi:hypothetical protein
MTFYSGRLRMMVTMRMLAAVVLLVSCLRAQNISFPVLREGVLEERLKRAHFRVPERYRRLRALFEETGCAAPQLREQPFRGSREPNLICEVAGQNESSRTLVVGAHFDAAGGDGVVDNWTGAILLPSLAEALRQQSLRHRIEFVGFAAEEQGMLGSRAYLKVLSKQQRAEIAAVVTMDSLGLSYTKFWPNSSSPELAQAAYRLAQSMQLKFSGVNVDRVGTTDSWVFHEAKIPVLSLHSVTQQTLAVINGPRDVAAAISWRDYYDTHRFVSALLVYLDKTLP